MATRAYVLVLLTLTALMAATAAGGPPKAQPLAGTDSHLEVPYVPAARLTGDPAWDARMALNLYVPQDGKETHPVVILIHGGGYGAGDKNEGKGLYKPELANALLKRGYAVCSLGYILSPARIFPQVWWDFRTAVRFLRANAATYKLDPEKVAAVGFSAGGWLSSTAGWTDADDIYCVNGRCENIAWFAGERKWNHSQKAEKDGSLPLTLPMDDPTPAWGEYSARVQALSFDFSSYPACITADDPAINVWGGKGFMPEKIAGPATKAGLDFSVSEITDPKVKPGAGVHVPSLTSATLGMDGVATVTLAERICQFIDDQLRTRPRALAPEVRPNLRVFAETAAIAFVVPKGYTVRYTLDGTEPTAASPAYDKPFIVEKDTVVKAQSFADGQRPSGVVTAHFFRNPQQVPPRITAPAEAELPRAKVGQPYTVTFVAEGAGAKPIWDLGGKARPYIPWQKKDIVYPFNLKLDGATGILAGTPDAPGRAWVQVLVAPERGRLASVRDYLLIVEP